ncbi:MAG: DUF4238 domain-containing protein [Parasporobacterium sp.]|nr:DUF4238 domain-containing protein [Parasporobacterium sp.]
MKEPVRHHYIPQFLLRQFCEETGVLHYYDKEKNVISNKKPEEVFVVRNLYRDELNNPDNPAKIEKDFARFENEASKIIYKFLEDDTIYLSFEEEEKLRLFLALMGFRSDRTKDYFKNTKSDTFKDFYIKYQDDENFDDLWKRNLGLIVNCRSCKEVVDHKDIDEPFKIFIMRDTHGIPFDSYFMILERRGKADFLLSDSYPAISEGSSDKGLKLELYSFYPISPSRALLRVHFGADATPKSILGFDQNFFKEPRKQRDKNVRIFNVQNTYEDDVRRLNSLAFETASYGVISNKANIKELL